MHSKESFFWYLYFCGYWYKRADVKMQHLFPPGISWRKRHGEVEWAISAGCVNALSSIQCFNTVVCATRRTAGTQNPAEGSLLTSWPSSEWLQKKTLVKEKQKWSVTFSRLSPKFSIKTFWGLLSSTSYRLAIFVMPNSVKKTTTIKKNTFNRFSQQVNGTAIYVPLLNRQLRTEVESYNQKG